MRQGREGALEALLCPWSCPVAVPIGLLQEQEEQQGTASTSHLSGALPEPLGGPVTLENDPGLADPSCPIGKLSWTC